MKKLLSIILTVLMMTSVLFGAVAVAEDATAPDVVYEHTNENYHPGFVYSTKGITSLKSKDAMAKGTVETVAYETAGVDGVIEKTFHVYLPAGYDPAQSYNVLYLMHGGGETQDYWLTEVSDRTHGKTTTRVLNRMIEDGLCDPLIIVTPTNGGSADFTTELRNDIIPLAESKYSSYAKGDVTEANLIATRDHRAYAGFSMGSGVGIRSILLGNMDVFGYLGNWSGGSAEMEEVKTILDGVYNDYVLNFWYNGDGTDDFAMPGHFEFYFNTMEVMSHKYVDGENSCFVLKPGAAHNYAAWIVDLYNCLLVFFK
jgi:hypothetical protein